MAPGRNELLSSGPGSVAHSDVAVFRWPAEAGRERSLAESASLRLLLVEPDAEPPVLDDARADWIRLPADERDVAARILGLVRRNRAPDDDPHVDGTDRLIYRGQWVALSPIEARLAAVLGQRLGDTVPMAELLSRAWPDEIDGSGPSESALRVHITRLRKRVSPIGLEVRSVRKHGLVMQPATGSAAGP